MADYLNNLYSAKRSFADVKALRDYFAEELHKLKDELEGPIPSDKILEIIEFDEATNEQIKRLTEKVDACNSWLSDEGYLIMNQRGYTGTSEDDETDRKY